MSTVPTIRIKSLHDGGFFIRNADDLRYGEVLFKSDDFDLLGEHEIRLMLESSPPDDFFEAEAKLWLEIKSKECKESDATARSAREIETLSIAKLANRIAIYAIIIGIILAIIGNHETIFSTIFNTP